MPDPQPPPGIYPVSFADVLAAVHSQLVNFGVTTDDNVHEVAQDDAEPSPTSDYDVVIRVGGPMPVGTSSLAVGRYYPEMRRQIRVTVRTRLNTDPEYENQQWLRDISNGHLRREELTLAALQNFFPNDPVTGNQLVYDSFKWMPSTEPKLDKPLDGWGQSTMVFECGYYVELPPTSPYTVWG